MTGYLDAALKYNQYKFPLNCPCECTSIILPDFLYEMQSFDKDMLDLFLERHLAANKEYLYCCNSQCNQSLEITEESKRHAQCSCPYCNTVMCLTCKAIWHDGFTCEQYQALPESERNPNDVAFLDMAASNRWKRCPSCKIMVEKKEGCHHIICECKAEFCYLCGVIYTWDIIINKYKPGCRCDIFHVPEDIAAPPRVFHQPVQLVLAMRKKI